MSPGFLGTALALVVQMPLTQHPTDPATEWLDAVKPPVQKPATGLPHVCAKLFCQPFAGVMFCVLLWAALLGIFRFTTFNEYQKRPIGDAAYFTEMTQAFHLGEPPAMDFPAMHSRRILGPWLAAKLCSAMDLIERRKATKAFHYGYYAEDYFRNWVPEDAITYNRIVTAWKTLNAAALLGILLGLFGILRHFQLQRALQWQPIWLALILCCSPTLGRLYFVWPMMNDLVGISLGLLSLLCLLKNRVILSGLLFGAAMLARENLALIYPCFLWLFFASPSGKSPKPWLLPHLIGCILPYSLLCAFPVFSNLAPLADWSSGIQQTTPGATHDYWALALYHFRRPFVAEHGLLRQFAVYWQVLGPLLLLALRFYPWRRKELKGDMFLWAGLLLVLGSSFYVDRYVVYAIFPLVLLARHGLNSRFSPFLAVCLSCFYLKAVHSFTECERGVALQVEFMDRALLNSTVLWGACALLLVLLEPILRTRLASVPRKTVLNQQTAMSFKEEF